MKYNILTFLLFLLGSHCLPTEQVNADPIYIDFTFDNTTYKAEAKAAAFGGSANNGINGVLVVGHPLDGCSKLEKINVTDGVVLLKRGGPEGDSPCQFIDKARHAQDAGAKAVIIFDNIFDKVLPIMCTSSSAADIHIPCVFTNAEQGQYLLNHFNSSTLLSLSPVMPYSTEKWCTEDLSFKWTPISFIVIASAFLALCLGSILAALRRRGIINDSMFLRRLDHRLNLTMDISAVNSLPSRIYIPLMDQTSRSDGSRSVVEPKTETGDGPSSISTQVHMQNRGEVGMNVHGNVSPTHSWMNAPTCVICLEDFTPGQIQRVLPCSHCFHKECVDEWLTKRRAVCPVCKADPTRSTVTATRNADAERLNDANASSFALPNSAAANVIRAEEPQAAINLETAHAASSEIISSLPLSSAPISSGGMALPLSYSIIPSSSAISPPLSSSSSSPALFSQSSESTPSSPSLSFSPSPSSHPHPSPSC